jgi:hypothetical protein
MLEVRMVLVILVARLFIQADALVLPHQAP